MSNIEKIKGKTINIVLDKERTIKYDLNAFAELEVIYGSVDAALQALESNSIIAVRNILWAGLIHEEMNDDGTYKISQKFVGSLVDLETLGEIMKSISEAIVDAMPAPDLQAGNEGN